MWLKQAQQISCGHPDSTSSELILTGLEDLDSPAQKLSDDPIKSTSSMRFLPGPYSTTRERPKTAAEKGKRESPTPWASQSSTSQRRQAMAAKILWTPRPDNATKQNLEKLLKWNADEYKEFRVSQDHCKHGIILTHFIT